MDKPVTEGAMLAPGVVICGDVTLEKDVNVWYGAVLRGDNGPIRVGEGTNIQDNCVLHDKTTIGKFCTIGHGAVVHGCTVGDYSLIGMGAVVLSGARIGPHCLVGGGAVVTGKTVAPEGSMLLGNPAKITRRLTKKEREYIRYNAEYYIKMAEQFR
ncbi:MAG: gamma carbonic anhydrase family protein [Candidatus Limivicinus sp.]|nr:gamma carbonic anhydrase family protein [Candidatus Limivicinus sp.]